LVFTYAIAVTSGIETYQARANAPRRDPDPADAAVHPLDTTKIRRAVVMSRDAGISVIAALVAFHNILRRATDVAAYLRNPDLSYLAYVAVDARRSPEVQPDYPMPRPRGRSSRGRPACRAAEN
jgi:hypothetical protein